MATSTPDVDDPEAFNIVGDVNGLMNALGEESATLVGQGLRAVGRRPSGAA